jgi:hypothetical protein
MRNNLLALLIAVLALGAGGYAVWGQLSTNSEKQVAQQQAKDVADPVAALCASDPTIYAKLSADSKARWDAACSKAAEVQQTPTPEAQPAGPTDAQIAAAVDSWLRAHPPAPGQNATPAMVATAVAQFLIANPPQPGRPPTIDEISTAASTYIASHAADFQGAAGQNGVNGKDGQNGQNGKDGRDGQDATDAQVAAAVDAYCSNHNGCAGESGAQGVSVTDVQFERDSAGVCQAVVTLHNPADGTDSTVTHEAGTAACPL